MTTWQERDRILRLLDFPKPKDRQGKNVATHLANLVKANEDEDFLPLVKNCLLASRNIQEMPMLEFYYWYKRHQMSSLDYDAYWAYICVVKDLYALPAGVVPDPSAFANGVGKEIARRLKGWLGPDAGNDFGKVLRDYFRFVCIALGRKYAMVSSLAARASGWNDFLIGIDKIGGKWEYVVPSRELLEQAEKEKKMLDYISEVKVQLIKEDEISLLDKIDDMLSKESIESVYLVLRG